jgi:hypothetical protein
VDYYGTPQDACPQCGSTADVRTVQDLVNMYTQMHDQAMQGPGPYQQGGYGPEPFYGPESGYGPGPRPRTDRTYDDGRPFDLGQEVFNEAMGAAGRFIGRAIGKRVRRAYEERVAPTLDARYQQARQEQLAIAERYPELRACLRDQVIFLAGGTRTVPLSEAVGHITLAQADAIVARLRQP